MPLNFVCMTSYHILITMFRTSHAASAISPTTKRTQTRMKMMKR